MTEKLPRPVSADAHDAVLTFGAILASNALTYGFYVVATRGLGVDAGGVVLALAAATLLVAAPATVLGTVLAGELARLPVLERGPASVRLERLALGVFAVSLAAFALATPVLAGFFHISIAVAASAAPAFAASLALPLFRAALQGDHAFGAFAVSLAVEGAGKFAVGLAALTGAASLAGTTAGYSMAQLAALGIAWWLARRRYHGIRPAARLSVRVPVRSVAALGALTVMTFADSAVARHVLDARGSSLFNASSLIGRALVTLVSFVPPVLVPIAAGAAPERRKVLLIGALVAIAAMAAIPAGIVATVPAFIVTLIAGPAYAAAAPLVRSYALAAVGLAFALGITSYGAAIGARGFALPLVLVALAELGGYAVRHQTAGELVTVSTVGHLCAAIAAAIVLFAGARRPAMPAQRPRDGVVETDAGGDAELRPDSLARRDVAMDGGAR